jgi:hypothetical protein
MNSILQKIQIISEAHIHTDGILALLMHQYSDFSPAEIVAILPYLTLALGGTYFATTALVVILLEIHRRGRVSDGTVSIDGQPLNDHLVNAVNEVNDTVSTATDLVDRATSIVEGQGGNIGPNELDRVRHLFDNADGIRRDLNEIGRLTEGVSNIHLDDFRTVMTDFFDAFESFMNSTNGF